MRRLHSAGALPIDARAHSTIFSLISLQSSREEIEPTQRLHMLARSSARAPALLRAAAPRLAAATSARGLAGPSSDAPPAPVPEEFLKGRTPERYAELEKLAEEHNGFLFGEVVRRAPAP